MRSAQSGARRLAPWRVLIAHDARATTCDGIVGALPIVLNDVDLVDAASIDAALATLATAQIDVCLVCLDLPPAPLAGVRFAHEVVRAGHPVVLVTRSLRWLPPNATALRHVPWVTPEATVDDLRRAFGEAVVDWDVPDVPVEEASEAVAGRRPS